MKNTKTLTLMLALILLALTGITPILATSQNYESAATARIVGSSPADMIKQLQNNKEMNLEKGIYAGVQGDSSKAYEIFMKIFGDFEYLLYAGYENLNSELDVAKDALLIINPYFSGASMSEISYLDSGEAKQLSAKLEKNNNLVVLNNPYSGLYLPYENSLVGAISPSTSMIAPMSYSSEMFLKAFLCNLGKYDAIGEAYRQARNNYYWNTDDKSELIGLTLISYALYGMPTRELKAPSADLKSYCSSYQTEFDKASASSSVSAVSLKDSGVNAQSGGMWVFSAGSGVYEKSFELNIDSYNTVDYGNYSLIEANNTLDSIEFFELVLPMKVIIEEFPARTIITNLSVVEISNPVELVVENLPSFDGFNYIDRECYEDEKEASVEFFHSYTKDSLVVLAKIKPVEIVNCTEGKFRLYRTAKYKIEYIPYSPILINEVSNPALVLPEQEFNISASLKKIQTSAVNGYLAIKDSQGNVVSAKEITADDGNYEIGMKAGEKEGFYTYRVDFYYDNESVTYKEFSFIVTTLELGLIVPEIATSKADVGVLVFSNLNNSMQTNLEYSLLYNNKAEKSDTKAVTLNPGLNAFTLTFDNLDRSKIVYDVLVGVPYSTKYKFVTAGIITEHVPVIIQNNRVIKENETFKLEPAVYDIDGDPVSLDIKYPFVYDENWKASFESSGNYEINITADDGIKQVTRTILLEIENVNRPPVLESLGKIVLKEGENVTINPTFWDPDNNNSVSNDDNNLTISYSGLINESGLLAADFDSSGNHTIYASVFDGELYDSKEIEVEIQNTNRPPFLASDSITIYENETLNISNIVFDPDNNNSVSNDNNIIEISADALFDPDGVWRTGFDDSGNYSVNIEFSDGEFSKNGTVSINVINVNRAPMVISSSNQKKYYISENSLLELNVSASDPDGDNVEIEWLVDSEKKAEGESFVFNANGQTGTYNVKVVANDSDLTSIENFEVVVSDVPILEGFDGSTSNMDKALLEMFYPFVIEKAGKGKIVFKEPVNLSEMVDFVNNALIEEAYVSLNDQVLTSIANAEARVYLYNINLEGNETPIIYYNENFGINNEEIIRVCPSSVCRNITYNNSILEFDISHFSTFFVKQSSGQQLGLNVPDSITLIADINTDYAEESFDIVNTGLADIDNLIVKGIFLAGNSISIFPTSISLSSGSSGEIKIEGSIMPLDVYYPLKIGEIIFEESSINAVTEVYAKKKAPFEITELKIEAGNEIYSSVKENEYILIEPNEEMNIKVSIMNNLEDSEVENAEVEVYVKDLDMGSDFEESTGDFDIPAGKDVMKELSFKLPELFEEDEYVMEIKVKGKAEETDYEITISVNLDTNKGEHEIKIGEIKFEPSEIECNGESELSVNVLNLGKNKEDVNLVVENKELGVYNESLGSISDGQKKTYSYPIEFENAISKVYTFNVELYSKDRELIDKKIGRLDVFECESIEFSETGKNALRLNGQKAISKFSSENIERIAIISLAAAIIVLLVVLIAVASRPKPKL